MLRIGGLWPRQVHGSLVVLLRDGRPANTLTVSASQGPATKPKPHPDGLSARMHRPKASLLSAGLPGGCLCHERGSILHASLTVTVLVIRWSR